MKKKLCSLIVLLSLFCCSASTKTTSSDRFIFKNGKPFSLKFRKNKYDDKELKNFTKDILNKINSGKSKLIFKKIGQKFNCYSLKKFKPGEKSAKEICLTEWKLSNESFISKLAMTIQSGGCFLNNENSEYIAPISACNWEKDEGKTHESTLFNLVFKTANTNLTLYDQPKGNKTSKINPFTIFDKKSEGRVWLPVGAHQALKQFDGWDKITLTDGTTGYVRTIDLEKGSFPFIVVLKKKKNIWNFEYISTPGEF